MQESNSQNANTYYEKGLDLFLAGRHSEALEYFELAAKYKHPAAYMYLYLMHQNSIGIDNLNKETINSLLLLMNKHNQPLMGNLPGKSYSHYADIQDNFGSLYFFGTGVEKDYKKAFQFYTNAADLRHPNAQNNLGYLYQYGLGTTKNFKEAFKHYGQAKSAHAWENMGIAFLDENALFSDLPLQLKKELKPNIGYEASANLYCAIYCFKQAVELTADEDHLYDINQNLARAETKLYEVKKTYQSAGVQTRSQLKRKHQPAEDKQPPQKKQRLENKESKDKENEKSICTRTRSKKIPEPLSTFVENENPKLPYPKRRELEWQQKNIRRFGIFFEDRKQSRTKEAAITPLSSLASQK